MNDTFNPQMLASDLEVVRRIYADFFATLTDTVWERPARRGAREWNTHRTVAHLCALHGAGLASIRAALEGTTYTFEGLEDRYRFNAYNEQGITEHLPLSRAELCARCLGMLEEAAAIARTLSPEQAGMASDMPIYNRPVKLVEALGIIIP
jgi:hypothetical protein